MRFFRRIGREIREHKDLYLVGLAFAGIMIGAYFLSGFGKEKEVPIMKETPRVSERALEKKVETEDNFTDSNSKYVLVPGPIHKGYFGLFCKPSIEFR